MKQIFIFRDGSIPPGLKCISAGLFIHYHLFTFPYRFVFFVSITRETMRSILLLSSRVDESVEKYIESRRDCFDLIVDTTCNTLRNTF